MPLHATATEAQAEEALPTLRESALSDERPFRAPWEKYPEPEEELTTLHVWREEARRLLARMRELAAIPKHESTPEERRELIRLGKNYRLAKRQVRVQEGKDQVKLDL